MSKVVMVTGGTRSGKSAYAERLALGLSPCPVYMATARIWDEDFRRRVEAHQARRGPQWTNVEEDKWLSRHDVAGRLVLVDCLTLWCTNFFFDLDSDVDRALEAVTNELELLLRQEATFIFVTNEIGLGGTSANELQRRFTDLQGKVNQIVAERADEVVLMVSGIPVRIKPSEMPGGLGMVGGPSVVNGPSTTGSPSATDGPSAAGGPNDTDGHGVTI